jgi:hypothetical protein
MQPIFCMVTTDPSFYPVLQERLQAGMIVQERSYLRLKTEGSVTRSPFRNAATNASG